MKKIRKLLAFLLVFVFASSFFFTSMVSYADEEEEEVYVDPLGGYKGLVAHWKFDGNLKDSSKFGNDGVAIGGKNGVTFVDGVSGSGVKLDGKSYIEVNDSDSLDLRDAFTFSFWVYKDDMRKKDYMEGGVPYLLKYTDDGYPIAYGVYEWWTLMPGVPYTDVNGEQDEVHAGKQVDIQKWTLITATYDGKSLKIYLDKQLVKSELKSITLAGSEQPLFIGFGNFMTVDNFFKGVLDDMRIYNKALSYGEIEDLYDEVVSKDNPGVELINKPKDLVAYYKFNGNLNDASTYKNNGIEISSKGGLKYEYGYAGKCVIFNGASYIEVQDSDSLDLDKGFTISAWLYMEKPKDMQIILAKYGESYNKNMPSYILQDWFGREILSLSDFDDDHNQVEFAIDESATQYGKWVYYAVTYKGSTGEKASKDDNTIKTYINGKLVSTEKFDGEISNSSGPLWIGAGMFNEETRFYKGKMDELRIYNYALTVDEIKRDMNIKDTITITGIKDNTLKVGATAQLKVTRLNVNDGKSFDVTSTASYKSSDTKILTVSKGKAKGVKKGKANITATYGLISGTLKNVTVK